MESVLNILQAVLGIVNEMSPYLLLGFLLAGIMHAFIPDPFVLWSMPLSSECHCLCAHVV